MLNIEKLCLGTDCISSFQPLSRAQHTNKSVADNLLICRELEITAEAEGVECNQKAKYTSLKPIGATNKLDTKSSKQKAQKGQ